MSYCTGMHPQQLRVYLDEITTQVRLANVAFENLKAALREPAIDTGVYPAFLSAQGVLTASAQISKLLWPEPRGNSSKRAFAKERGSALRAAVSPNDILKTRAVRNSVEHFDERLDTQLGELNVQKLGDLNIADPGAINIPGMTSLRNLAPSSLTYSALGEEISLLSLMEALNEIGQRAAKSKSEV